MSLKKRMAVLLMFVTVLPQCINLYFIAVDNLEQLRIALTVHLVVSLIFALPLSGVCSYVFLGRDITELHEFCKGLKKGIYTDLFQLPNESNKESERLKLKRLLNWIAYSLARKEKNQEDAFKKTRKLNQHLKSLSFKDGLTELSNRRRFDEYITDAVESALENKQNLSLVMIDIDNFKQINDNYGHLRGDRLLKDLAYILKSSVENREGLGFRFGGDEFALVLPDVRLREAVQISERLRVNYGLNAPPVTSLSVGVVQLDYRLVDIELATRDLIHRADENVYAAKRNGRNSVMFEEVKSDVQRYSC